MEEGDRYIIQIGEVYEKNKFDKTKGTTYKKTMAKIYGTDIVLSEDQVNKLKPVSEVFCKWYLNNRGYDNGQ